MEAKLRVYIYTVNNLDTGLVLIKTIGSPCVRNTICVHTGKLWEIYEQAQVFEPRWHTHFVRVKILAK